jgi:pimeloyl-ACP methyl ester carboxylesterase
VPAVAVNALVQPQPSRLGREDAHRVLPGEPTLARLLAQHRIEGLALDRSRRSYWEDGQALAQARASGQAPPEVSLPVGFTTFPGEIWRSPRSWVEQAYPNLTYFNEVDKGGHFAAWEEPELFSSEVRAAFWSLR